MHPLLSQIESAADLHTMTVAELKQLADEIRDALCSLLNQRTAHFASNLGVVELCLALHSVFDFRHDRLIWDTGHQIYPHKLVTGRYHEFATMRTRNGLMGYPNPAESEYDLFMTGHAGCSLSTVFGMKVGDELMDQVDRRAVAVIGDGAFPSGIVYEAMNNLGGLKKKLLVVLNDNKMSICPRVGGLSSYLDRLRVGSLYTGLKRDASKILNKVPLFGDPAERFFAQLKEAIKAGMHGGMLFEELGFRYIGPIDGHNVQLLRKYLNMVKDLDGPTLLHVVTEKGHGFRPAEEDPAFFHTPPAFENEDGLANVKPAASGKTYTHFASEAIFSQMEKDSRVTVLTAAMCQGNKLEAVRDAFADRFFDTGICEAHAVAFAAGMAKSGMRPIVDIYSTFLQRSYDQIFQEVALQGLPVTFMLDRAGLTGPDGPTHHGTHDLAYLRVFPNMVVMAPGDARDLSGMLDLALHVDVPCSLRYPKTGAVEIERPAAPLRVGEGEIMRWGDDGMIICLGTLLSGCLEASEQLRKEGMDVGVINARFVKPLDQDLIGRALRTAPFVVTVEEAALMGGFGSAVLEFANQANIDTQHVKRLGIPDQFVEHGDRTELLADLGLDQVGVAAACREMAERRRLSDAGLTE